jgi:hypothetical protein
MRKVTVSFLLAVLASVLGLALPLYREQTRLQRPGEPNSPQIQHVTLTSVNGPLIYYILAMPVFFAGVPISLRFRAVRIISAVLLTGCVFIGAASIGFFYLPSAITMILAASEKPT